MAADRPGVAAEVWSVEAEVVAPALDLRGTEVFALALEWVAARVTAQLDPLGLNPVILDLAEAFDALRVKFRLSDAAEAGDARTSRVRAALASIARADDFTGMIFRTRFADSVPAVDAVQLIAKQVLASPSIAVDAFAVKIMRAVVSEAEALDALATRARTAIQSAIRAADAGRLVKYDYVADGYVTRGYVAATTTF